MARYILWSFIALCLINFVLGDISCPRKCICGKASVDCSFKGFTTVPSDIDPDTETL